MKGFPILTWLRFKHINPETSWFIFLISESTESQAPVTRFIFFPRWFKCSVVCLGKEPSLSPEATTVFSSKQQPLNPLTQRLRRKHIHNQHTTAGDQWSEDRNKGFHLGFCFLQQLCGKIPFETLLDFDKQERSFKGFVVALVPRTLFKLIKSIL